MDEGVYYTRQQLAQRGLYLVNRIQSMLESITQRVGGGGSNIEQDWGLSDEWPPVVSNGFTGG